MSHLTLHALTALSYDDFLASFLRAFRFLANLAGGIVIGIGTIRALFIYTRDLVLQRDEAPREDIRLNLGRSLALALELQLGADILGTALNPSGKDIGILAAIVILRTALNFFLQRELREAGEQPQGQAPPVSPIPARREAP